MQAHVPESINISQLTQLSSVSFSSHLYLTFSICTACRFSVISGKTWGGGRGESYLGWGERERAACSGLLEQAHRCWHRQENPPSRASTH